MFIDNIEIFIGIANLVFFLGVVGTVALQISKLNARFDIIDARLDGIDARIDKMEARIDARIDKLEDRIDKLSADVEEIKSYTKFSDLQSNQIRDLQKEGKKTSEELIKVKIAVENMGAH